MPFQLCRSAILSSLCAYSLVAWADPPAPASPTPSPVPGSPAGLPGNTTSPFWTQNQVTGDFGDLRPQMEKNGLTFGLDVVSQLFGNFVGGIHRGTTMASTLDLKISQAVETSGTLYLDLQEHAGPDPSQNLTGDIQKFSDFNNAPFFHAAELWYEQSMLNDTWRLKIGKMDANNEFYIVDNGANFLNSSAQISPAVVDFPTYPTTMLGANIFFTPGNTYYASFGVYDATRGDKFLDFKGASQNNQFPAGGVFLIGETGLKWASLGTWQADGNLRLGGWEETGSLPTFDGGEKDGTYGFYGIFNQTLWKPDWDPAETRGVRMFLEYAETPGDVSIVDRHIGAGFTWTGPFPNHPADVIGIGPEYVNLSDKAGVPKPFELAAEAFYLYQLAPWALIQPDLQYICHPGGIYPNALVGTLQVTLHF